MENGLINVLLEWTDISWQHFDASLDEEKKFNKDFILQSTVIFKGTNFFFFNGDFCPSNIV